MILKIQIVIISLADRIILTARVFWSQAVNKTKYILKQNNQIFKQRVMNEMKNNESTRYIEDNQTIIKYIWKFLL